METLYLRRDEDRRVKRGHPWVYSNELDVARAPVKGLVPGAAVRVCDARGQLVGIGHVSPASLIAVRLLARRGDDGEPTLEGIIAGRVARALAFRRSLFSSPFYRLVYAEGDGLPGLVIDRFGDACVIQTATAGMDARLAEIIDAVDAAIAPTTIVVKNDAGLRSAEGLETYVEVIRGEATVELKEAGARFQIDLAAGQKTGWFFDQRDNRVRFSARYRDARVLDLYSYVGGWGVLAALAGAAQVVCVDASATAIAAVVANAQLNGVEQRIEALRSEVTDVLAQRTDQFDVVVLDPPALVKRRKDLKAGRALYRHLNSAALARVAAGGILVSCSCSSQVDPATHLADIRAAARHVRRDVALIGRGGLPPDHPIHPLLPEMEYLKCLFLRVD
jgi:23S rRNA (cytosine1962-C5)-methyltransferase